MQVRDLLVKQSLAGKSTSAGPEMFWLKFIPVSEFLPHWAPLLPGALSGRSAQKTQPPLSSGTEDCPGLGGFKLQPVVLGYCFQPSVKLKARKSCELELHFDFHVWKRQEAWLKQDCRSSCTPWCRAVTLGRLPRVVLSIKAALEPEGLGCSHSYCAELAFADAAATARDHVTDQPQAWELGNCVLQVFWCFWGDLSGNFQFVGIFKRVCFLLDLDQSHRFR